ncbi:MULTISPECIES: DUF99 family protein [Metallosphaera]|uniref:UPF0215 protein Msed_0002 n=3 Tax=Metallosphaera TaxID=41980 RepID=A4YCM7_METS5|nr:MULTISPECIES: DUF99 family protein [Metallosphaera]ABP94179.1 protein of unknown function DUF99 [Metallosphaera sedula DSM 5348]AIM26166.1 protein of unknown function DUF99 [Metallosphaera sedula]AKV73196.1 hypothetical protein MsedA_0003 [Metallosphaera sedula]AKV75440.1 hypothetical protein MsedB_0003 [Metallosphaera sedula]AKV77686.1 hypothetical protein MsedC_0002 [Metallosphaera sedula]
MLISGVDDGYFPLRYKGQRGKAPLVVTLFDGMRLKDLRIGLITVDGRDARDVFSQINWGVITMYDGITFGGFNYIIPERNFIVVYGNKPNLEEVEKALRAHFQDDRGREIMGVLERLTRIETRWGPLYLYTDLDLADARRIVEGYQVISKYPEPIRYAHVIGRAVGMWREKS